MRAVLFKIFLIHKLPIKKNLVFLLFFKFCFIILVICKHILFLITAYYKDYFNLVT